jgi:curved DNA-binding protein CbpA
LAVYSLFTDQEIHDIQGAVEEAYRVLMDETLRKTYDQSHFQRLGKQELEKPPESQAPAREKRPPHPSAEIQAHVGEEACGGKALKQIREKMGIDLETIAQETRIHLKTLEVIEQGDPGKLPPLVYLKGFLKGYAQSLGLDPHKVAEGYLLFLEEEKKKITPS